MPICVGLVQSRILNIGNQYHVIVWSVFDADSNKRFTYQQLLLFQH